MSMSERVRKCSLGVNSYSNNVTVHSTLVHLAIREM